eukprot:scaffold24845_cov89-Phaeocystis_antarctica.AAC.3
MGRCFPRSIATTGSIEFCSAALYCAVGIMHPAEHPAPDAGFHRIQLETATIPLDGGTATLTGRIRRVAAVRRRPRLSRYQ